MKASPLFFTQRVLILFPALLFLALPAVARTDWAICGTSPTREMEERMLHERWSQSATRKAEQARTAASGKRANANRDIGNIAIIEDQNDVVSRRNPFDLLRQTLRFTPTSSQAAAYRYGLQANAYDASQAQGPAIPLGDDETREVLLPFAFPFYGRSYSSVWVNSDGNLTFGEGDTSTESRSVARHVAVAPRISALFHDLDPSRPNASVRTFSGGGVFVITWVNVPRFATFTGQNVQIRLFPSGVIELNYDAVSTQDAIVGIAPGRLQGGTTLVDFTAAPVGTYTGAIAERFTAIQEIDLTFVAQRFYETHDDSYDFLAVYNNMNIDADVGAVAYAITYRNGVTGTNQDLINVSNEFGSPKRLQTLINLGQLTQYADSPTGLVLRRGNTGDTPLSIIAHEAGHRFLAYAGAVDRTTNTSPMLSNDGAHYAFTFNSDASLMEGNRIRDNGLGTSPRFTTTGTVEGFSFYDLYLMGLATPDEVPPSFYVTNATINRNLLPERGRTFDGTRRDVGIFDVIFDNGPRRPDSTVAQRRFRVAFILVAPAATAPTSGDLAKVELFRSQFEAYFAAATKNRATVDTTLRKGVDLSLWPAAGIPTGGTRRATVSIAEPAGAALTLNIQSTAGILSAPGQVTIPQGSRSAQFDVRGLAAGTGEVTVQPASSTYSGDAARIQVLSPQGLKLVAIAGENQSPVAGQPLQPIRFRITDENRLTYEGVTVSAGVSTGVLVNDRVVSNADGIVEFRWTPGAGTRHTLTASVAGGAMGEVATVVLDSRVFTSSAGIVNAASFRPGLVPGSIATIFGANLTGGQRAQGIPPLPNELAGVTVTVAGRPAALYFVSDVQINLVVPVGVAPGAAEVVIRHDDQSIAIPGVPVYSVQPAIFQSGGSGAILVYPEYLEIYATGLGPLATGPSGLPETTARPQVSLGGTALELLYSGPAPGFPGLYQVNVRRPANTTGTFSLNLTAGGSVSNTVNVTLP